MQTFSFSTISLFININLKLATITCDKNQVINMHKNLFKFVFIFFYKRIYKQLQE